MSKPPPLRPETATRIFLRPIASPLALGFLGLGGATVTLSGLELGWIPSSEARQVGLIVVLFAPLLQAIACVFGFLARDAVAATGMGTLAGGWAVIGAATLLSPHGTNRALGMFLLLAATGVLLSAVIAAQSKLVPAIVMLTTAIRWYLTAIYQLNGSTTWRHATGYAGLVLGAFALYAAISVELEDINHRPILPTLRYGRGSRVVERDLAFQVDDIENAAGVRREL